MLHYMSRLQNIAAAPAPRGSFMAEFSKTIIRDRYQIWTGIALAVGVPMIIRSLFFVDLSIMQPLVYNTIVSSALAIILGYISFRNIHVFPGITSSGYIATSLTIWFGIVMAILLFLRLEYTTVQLFFSYVISIAFFTFINLFFVNRQPIRLGVIPSPSTSDLPQVRRVEWIPIASLK